MDKDKNVDISQCSWMEMHQFIGDLLASGHSSKNQPDVLNAAWGAAAAAGGAGALGLKASSLEPLQLARPAQDGREAPPGKPTQHRPPHTRREAPDRGEGGCSDRQKCHFLKKFSKKEKAKKKNILFPGCSSGFDVHHACTCPGCPYSSPPPSFETLVPRQSLPSSQHSEAACRPKDLSLTMCSPDTTVPSSSAAAELESRPSGQTQRDNADRAAQSQGQNLSTPLPRASSGSLSHLSMFPCLCCHHGLQTCPPALTNQKGNSSPFSHSHHHFHHHLCALTSCLPCPQLSHSAQLPAPFPCLTCQCSPPTCPQVCHHPRRQTQQQEERGRGGLLLHPCMHCPASFTRPSQLLQHQRSEHAHKPPGFLCTECGRAFNSHSNLRIHLNVHSGARPYSCSECGKSFSQSGALKIHKRIHTGERPYSCGFCGRGFPNLAGVRAHQRIHTGEKPYRCGQCGKCFTQSGALKIHTRIHTGERPFICRFCGKCFSNRSGIRFHYRTVHGLAPEHAGEPGVPDAPSRPAGYSPGRPRTLPSTSVGLDMNKNSGSDSHATAGGGATHVRGNESGSPAEREGSHSGGLLYACEDCGLRFKDAPSRNRHQTLVHYSHEGQEEEEEEDEEEEEEEEGRRKEFTMEEGVNDHSQ
ncbi:zinc finger protein 586 isoform X2 [Cololabis saira]|uniref:zinc finger protein 586 isoform X2 n=1 Tax=Cololabis saira TaxID=129043 RepID=UPI002AD1F342|nr:zinc finger protein 586 isoform X2 [Cololabis saira]